MRIFREDSLCCTKFYSSDLIFRTARPLRMRIKGLSSVFLRSFSAVARQKLDPPSIPLKSPIEPAPGLDGPVRPPHPVRSRVHTAQAFLYTSTGAPGLGLPAHQEGLGGAGSTQAPNDCLSFTYTRIGFAHCLASLHTSARPAPGQTRPPCHT